MGKDEIEARLRKIAECCTCPPGTYGSGFHHHACVQSHWIERRLDALREAAALGAQAQREGVPHLTIMPWFKTTTAESGDHHPSECAHLGGRCAKLVIGEES